MPSFQGNFIGNGAAAGEAPMDINPSFTIQPGQQVSISDYAATYEGAGHIRLRAGSVNGTELFRLRFQSDGPTQRDSFKQPLKIGNADVNPLVVFVTQDAAGRNSLLLIGSADDLTP